MGARVQAGRDRIENIAGRARLRQTGGVGRHAIKDWALAGEAFASLAVARLTLMVVPFPTLARRLSAPLGESRASSGAIPRRIGWAVSAVSRHSPIPFVCFPQALAARAMLRRRGIPATLHYGVAMNDSKVRAHVWLSALGTDVVGYVNKSDFKLIAMFPEQADGSE